MTPELRRALVRRQLKIEQKLGLRPGEDPQPDKRTASQKQADQMMAALGVAQALQKRPSAPRRAAGGDDWADEMAEDATARRAAAAARDAQDGGRPNPRKGESVTEFQLRLAGMLEDDDEDEDDDD